MNIFLLVLIVFVFAWWLCYLFSKPSSILYVLDEVTDRSMHTQPKPRTGGVAVVSAIILIWLIYALITKDELFHYILISGLIILSVVSYLDDRNSVSKLCRLIVHIFVAFLMMYGLFQLSGNLADNKITVENWFLIGFISVLIVVWSINLYNFMDGMDGLAGGMGVIGFSCLAWFGWAAGNNLFFLLTIVIAAANLGFLAHNFPPAKIFLGDAGSTAMGYLAAFFSLWGIHASIFSWWAPMLVFSPFIVDASITLTRRVCSGERFWEAHNSHYYQKIVQMGFGQTKTVIAEYILMFSLACTSIMLHLISDNNFTTVLCVAWLIFFVCIISLIEREIFKSRGKS